MIIITLLLLDLLKENAYAADASVYCPDKGFTDNTVTNVTGSFNSSVLTPGKCKFNVTLVNFLFIRGTSNKVLLCRQTFSTSPQICNTNFTTQNCKCDNVTGEMFYYTYRFTTNASVHDGGVIELKTDCVDNNGENPLTNETCTITIPTTTTASTTTSTTTATTTITTTPPPDKKCPGWCIAVIIIAIILFIVIIIIVIIIIKCKKEKRRGNRFHCCFYDIRKKEKCHSGFYHEDESASHNIYKFHCCSYDIRKNGTCPCGFYPDDESASHYIHKFHCCSHEKHKGACPSGFYPGDESSATSDGTIQTELKHTTPPQSGKNRNKTKQTVQDTKELQDRNKHLGTDNSPEKEKRSKKKKKKKTFQEVDGEPVSSEDKLTVNDHKAAENDNSISVNESSQATDNGGHRSLPMPKATHLTPVERNSTIVKSETPRKLPPLQLKQ